MSKVTFGMDPESFLIDANGAVIPGTLLFPTHYKTSYGFICHDGVQTEFNPFPSDHIGTVVANLNGLIQTAMNIASDFSGGPVTIKFDPVQEVPLEIIKMAGDADASALEFGCSPDVNVWDRRDKSFRGDASNLPLRFGGGHFHINVSGSYEDKANMVRKLERTVGLAINANAPEEDEKRRRQYYGKAGACRIKEYGIEWRTPSSAVFKSAAGQPSNYKLEQYMAAMGKVVSGAVKDKDMPMSGEETREFINAGKSMDVWSLF